MNKPTTLKVKELQEGIIEQINKAGLHVAIVKPIIQEINVLIQQEYERTYKQELEQYKKEQEGEVEQHTVPNEELEDNTPE